MFINSLIWLGPTLKKKYFSSNYFSLDFWQKLWEWIKLPRKVSQQSVVQSRFYNCFEELDRNPDLRGVITNYVGIVKKIKHQNTGVSLLHRLKLKTKVTKTKQCCNQSYFEIIVLFNITKNTSLKTGKQVNKNPQTSLQK